MTTRSKTAKKTAVRKPATISATKPSRKAATKTSVATTRKVSTKSLPTSTPKLTKSQKLSKSAAAEAKADAFLRAMTPDHHTAVKKKPRSKSITGPNTTYPMSESVRSAAQTVTAGADATSREVPPEVLAKIDGRSRRALVNRGILVAKGRSARPIWAVTLSLTPAKPKAKDKADLAKPVAPKTKARSKAA